MTTPVAGPACKQHPDRSGGVTCQRCGEAMCPSCMHQASVGYHCPTCTRSAAKAAAPAQRMVRVAMQGHRPIITQVIMAVSVLVFVWDGYQASIASNAAEGFNAIRDFGLWAPAVEFDGEWYRIVTSAFTHSGLMHIGFNMYILWQIGQSLEGRFGSLTFGALYATGIMGGSFGAMLIEPTANVVGASGAVFALMGALVALQYMAGLNIFDSGIGRLLMLNVFISFLPGISLGGHFGGLAAGLVCGAILGFARKSGAKALALAPAAIAAVGLVLFLGLIPVIDRAAGQFL